MGLIVYSVSCVFIQMISYDQYKQILRKPAFS